MTTEKQKIAGALFDLMGFLTTREKRLELSSNDDAAPACEVLGEFAKLRGLDLSDPDIKGWNS